MNEMTQEEKEHLLSNRPTPNNITPEHIDATIETVRYVHTGETTTIAILTLRNGYEVLGQSACADPANYEQALGQQLALEDGKKKIWPLEGYLLKQRLYEEGKGPFKGPFRVCGREEIRDPE